MLYKRLIRPLVFAATPDPEVAHQVTIALLSLISRNPVLIQALETLTRLLEPQPSPTDCEVFGLRFPNRIGLAAGFDKNAVAVPALAALGFGFIEVGTVTRDSQPGNPRPRLVRLPMDEAVINRMGFNNDGAQKVAERMAQMQSVRVPIGISLGKSLMTPVEDALRDYFDSLGVLYPYGDYFVVNVSSPNTPGLRVLQEREWLDELLLALTSYLRERADDEHLPQPKPLLVKAAPELDTHELDEIIEVCIDRGISGLIVVNTSTDRTSLSERVPQDLRNQSGGLSGRPLLKKALSFVQHISSRSEGKLPVVGCGGICYPDDVRRMFEAGASLVQLYTGLIYEGPLIARRLVGVTQASSVTKHSGILSNDEDRLAIVP